MASWTRAFGLRSREIPDVAEDDGKIWLAVYSSHGKHVGDEVACPAVRLG